MLQRWLKRLRREDGAAVVEFALVLPILMILVFGIVDFARAFYTINSLVSAAREGARYGALLEEPLSSASRTAIVSRVRAASYPFGGERIADAQIFVTFDGQQVAVRIHRYPFELLNPLGRPIGDDGKLYMTRQAVFRWERAP